MLKQFVLILRHPQIRVATITIFCLGFTFASTLPYHSIIGIHQLGLSERQFGLLMLAMGVFGTVGNVLIGHFSDLATNRKSAILVSFAVGAIGFGTFALFPSVWTFVLCLIVVMPISSSAFSQLFAVIRTITNEQAAGQAASVNSAVRSIFAVSWILVPGLVGAYVAISDNVSDSFGIAALAFVFCFVLYWIAGPSIGRDEPPAQGRWRSLLVALQKIFGTSIFPKVGALALIAVAHPLNAVIMPLIIIGLPGGSTRDIGILAGLVAALEIPFMLLGTTLVARWGIVRVIVLGGACHIAYLLGLSFANAVWHIFPLALLNAAGAAAILSLYISYLQDLLPDQPGLGTSLNSIENLLARGMAAAIMAGVGTLFGLPGAALLGTVLIAAGGAAIMILDQQSNRRLAAK